MTMGSSKTVKDSIILQERDLSLLRGLLESRIMTTEQAALIYIDGKLPYAKKRVQRLKETGYISCRERRLFEPSILSLSPKGLKALNLQGVLAEYPPLGVTAFTKRASLSEASIRHELEIMDVKASFAVALRKSNTFSLAEFTTWPLLNEFEAVSNGTETTIKPDGFIRIHENEPDGGLSEHTFFLEADRSSETLDTLVSKALAYLHYYKSGGFAEKNGAKRSEYKEYPFRVLMTFKTAERRNNMAERLLLSNPPILTQVYLSTIAEVLNDPFGAVWIRPLDYREAVKGTPFEPKVIRQHFGYARKTFIIQNVYKSQFSGWKITQSKNYYVNESNVGYSI